ncbi:MAG: carboxypeptidase regulatory-like domain-containing protein [Terriglobales bacterium]
MTRTRFAAHVALIAVCAFLLTTLAHAQYRGSIRGTVTDPTGAVVSGATVTLLNTDTNFAITATSDQNGLYIFNAIPAAPYKITVEHPGFKTKVLESVRIIPDQPNALDLPLEMGQVKEIIEVTGTTETVDRETATVSGTLSSTEINTMPSIGRNVFMLAQMAPGITGDNSQGASGGGNNMPGNTSPGNPGLTPGVNQGIFATENGPQATAGGLATQHNGISIDGISTTSAVWGGASVITPSEDAVAEVKIISNAYDAEYGRFAAAQIQITSRSGSNQPHGSFFFTAHRPGLDAYQRWNALGAAYALPLRDDTFFDQLGGSLGAPIWKNKVFGFFSWETARSPAGATTYSNAWMETPAFQTLAPSGSIASQYLSYPGSIPSNATIIDVSCASAGFNANGLTNCIDTGQGLNIGSPLTTGLGTQDLGWVSASNPGVGGGLNPSGPADIAEYHVASTSTYTQNQYIGRVDAYLTQKDRLSGSIYWVPQSNTTSGLRAYDLFHHSQVNDAFSLIWNRVISSSFVNEARVNAAGWRWNEIKTNPQMPFGLPADNISQSNGAASLGNVSLTTFGPNIGSDLDQWTYTYKDVATKVLGRHTIKFGGELTRLFYLQSCYGCALPSYAFYNIWDFLNDAPNLESANVSPATGIPTIERQDQRENIWGFFVQDDYKLRSNLTVNLGLRWSYFAPLSSKQNNMYRGVPGSGDAFLTGLNVVKENGFNAQKNNFSPEIGFAWSPNQFGGKMVFRGGFGINYNQEEIAISANISGNPGLAVSQSLSSSGPAGINPNILYATATNLHSLVYPSNPAFIAPLGANGLPTPPRIGRTVHLPPDHAHHQSPALLGGYAVRVLAQVDGLAVLSGEPFQQHYRQLPD